MAFRMVCTGNLRLERVVHKLLSMADVNSSFYPQISVYQADGIVCHMLPMSFTSQLRLESRKYQPDSNSNLSDRVCMLN